MVVLAWVANVQFSDREHRGCFTLLGHIAAFVGQWEHKANGCLFLDISVSQNDLGLSKSLRTWRVYLALEGQWEVPSHSQGWSSFCCSSHSFWLSSKGQSWREQSCRFQEHKLKINSWKPFQPFIFDFFFFLCFWGSSALPLLQVTCFGRAVGECLLSALGRAVSVLMTSYMWPGAERKW